MASMEVEESIWLADRLHPHRAAQSTAPEDVNKSVGTELSSRQNRK